jgi:hypothetical protein
VAVADVNGDGKPDLIVGHGAHTSYSGSYGGSYGGGYGGGGFNSPATVSVLLGNGDGTFQNPQTFPVGRDPTSVAVADVNGDGKPDLVVANSDNTVSVLLGNSDGTFQPQQAFPVGTSPAAVAVADVNGDGKPDLVVANYGSNTVSVLLGNGDGTFQPQQTFAVGTSPAAVAVADVNGDGRPDLVVANSGSDSVSVLLGNGVNSFTRSAPSGGLGLRNTPHLADLEGDGIPDSVILDRSGNILFRRGLPGTDSLFAPPVILNPGRPARDLTVVKTGTGWAAAAAETRFDSTLAGPNAFVYTVSLYTVAADGAVTRRTAFSTPLLPTRIAAADLTGNGRDDLIVANALDNSIQVVFQQPDGTFSSPITLPAGATPSDISVVDLNGDGLPDIAVTNQVSGDVSVFLNDPGHRFATSYRFRAGMGPYGLDTTAASPAVTSLEESVSLAAGDFTGSGRNDLVVVNRGAHSLSVLANDGSGGFGNPRAALTTSTSDGPDVNAQPGPAVAGAFHGPSRPLDLAILMKERGEVWVFTGNGDGTFRHTFSIPAGASPTGLNVVRNPQTGQFDLLVGDPFGDVLHLQGKGDGTFQVAGSRVSLAAQDLGGGRTDVLVANQQTDRVTVEASQPGSPQFVPVVTLADGTHSTLAPGTVQWAKLDQGSPFFDAVVVASGGNEVLVYRGTGFDAAGHPTFAPPVNYPVGTDPVSVTIQDVNGDGVPDLLVADQGSNDVAELFGSWDANGNWVGTLGPRLKSGGSGPVATAVRDVTGDGIPDLVVTNGTSGTLSVLPGVGQGFFNDQNPQALNVPGNPVLRAPVFFGTSGVGVVPTATGQLFGVNLNTLTVTPRPIFTPPPGAGVAAVQALPNGDLVVAEEGGTVQLLAPGPGSAAFDVVETFEPLTGIPSEPSALAVLEDGSEVLVTNQGQDQLFVFGLPGSASAGSLSSVQGFALPPLAVASSPVAEASSPAEAPLAVVVALVADVLPAGPAASPGGSGVPAAVPEGNAVNPVEGSAAVDPAGDEEGDDALPAAAAGADADFDPAIEESLRQLDLHRRTDDEAWGGPIADRALPDLPGTVCGGRDGFWQVGLEGPGQAECGLALLPHLQDGPPSRTSAQAKPDGGGPDSAAEDAAVWLDGPDPGTSRPAGALPPRPGPGDPTRDVVVTVRDWRWEVPLLAALAAGGLYLAGARPAPGGAVSRVRAKRPRLRVDDGR